MKKIMIVLWQEIQAVKRLDAFINGNDYKTIERKNFPSRTQSLTCHQQDLIFHRFQFINHTRNHAKTLVPERRIACIQAKWGQKVFMML